MDPSHLYNQLVHLNNNGLYRSAVTLGTFLLEQTNSSESQQSSSLGRKSSRLNADSDTTASLISLSLHYNSLVVFADALLGLKEHKRAMSYYRQALKIYKLAKANSSESDLACKESELKFKMVKCYLGLDDDAGATRMLEGIPSRSRTIEMHLRLAELYRKSGFENDKAVECYTEVLRECPFALEAKLALVELEQKVDDLDNSIASLSSSSSSSAALNKGDKDSSGQSNAFQETNDVLNALTSDIARVNQHVLDCAPKKANTLISTLMEQHPNNPVLLLAQAKLHVAKSRFTAARSCFESVLELDENILDGMDEYATVLKMTGSDAEVNRLAKNMINVDIHRPEPWVAFASFCEARGWNSKALKFLDKSLELNPHHLQSLVQRGALLTANGDVEGATATYRAALHISKDITVYRGLVSAHLAAQQYKEALSVAKIALERVPKNASTLTLVGTVLIHNPEGRVKARKAFTNALTLEPDSWFAIDGLVQLNALEQKFEEAIELLEREQNNQHDMDTVYCRIGDL